MHDPIQVVKEFENCSEMVSSSQVNSENIPQDGSEVINFFFLSSLLHSSEEIYELLYRFCSFLCFSF